MKHETHSSTMPRFWVGGVIGSGFFSNQIIMSKKLDLASQQFIGYYAGKWGQLIGMIEAMGLTEKEWAKLQKDYPLELTDSEIKEINDFFNPPKEICYKTNEACKYDCPGVCRDSV